MRIATLAAVGASLFAAAAPQAQNMVITGVFDGPLTGGTPKAIELYVTANIADLGRYGVGSANNGGGTDGAEFIFPAGTAATAGSFIEVASEAPGFLAYFGSDADYVSGAANINGDDAIELFFDANSDGMFTDNEVIDVFGQIDVDGTDQPWEYLDGWAYRTNGTGPDGTTFVIGSWTFSGINATDGELTNDTAVSRFPIRSYSPMGTSSEPVASAGTLSMTLANPVRGATQVRVSTPATEARLAVYDVLGREVAALNVAADTATLPALAPGVYVLRLTAGADVLTRTVTVVR